MLDINYIRENTEIVKKAVLDKGIDLDVKKLLQVDEKRRELLVKIEELRRQRNEAAENRNIEAGKQVKQQLDNLEPELKTTENELAQMLLYVPNIPTKDAPIGLTSDSNEVIFKWGEIKKPKFKIRDHVELGKLLDIIDLEVGSKVAGFRGYYLKNTGAILHWAVLNWARDYIISKGFTLMVPPTLVGEKVLIGSGHFPTGRDNIYQIGNPGKLESGEDIKHQIYLSGTSEPSLLAYYLDSIIPEEDLPIKLTAMTHCYRSEVGDYGKDTKGLYRVHEFDKVEQVVICKNDPQESAKWFGEMQAITEHLLQELTIPYRVVNTSTGDMGAGKIRMHDIEVWMMGRGKYGEICSNSNLGDWQMRRTNTKVKTKAGNYFPYALNSTVMPSPRILIPILENNQTVDGTVIIPKVLQKYTGFSEIKPKL